MEGKIKMVQELSQKIRKLEKDMGYSKRFDNKIIIYSGTEVRGYDLNSGKLIIKPVSLKVNDVLYVNNELYIGNDHFSKIKDNKLIEICNYYDKQKHSGLNMNLFDALFNGFIYNLSLNKNSIEFESNADDYIDVKYNFLENKFNVKVTKERRDWLKASGAKWLSKKKKGEKVSFIPISSRNQKA